MKCVGGRMKLWRRQSLFGVIFAVLVLGLIVAACAPNADVQLVSPKLGEQLFAEEAGQAVKVEPTPVPLAIKTMTPEQITAGLPPDFVEALKKADPTKGP